eukprot:TRINITY_DN8932_c0_g1_i1.p1 TRINITY_DN8932_c0_g1~~TRINITY_DN8932_c0_g1_i1.p1  ORF type:complete len:304 (+),score=25.30 TRINITY_DN8932_c0_g1_i1:60-914(+)
MRTRVKGKTGADNNGKTFVCGALAGTFSKTVTAPLARLTILRQVTAGDAGVKLLSMKEEMIQIVRSGGARQLFRGNTAAVCHRVPFSGVYHTTYNKLSKSCEKSNSFAIKLVNGSIAGALACSAAYPLDLARSLIASGKSESPRILTTLFTEVQKGKGIRSCYRGLYPTLVQVTPNLGVNYAVYDTITTHSGVGGVPGTLLSAASAGVASSVATHPLDVIRRLLQVDGAAGTVSKFNGSWLRAASTVVTTNPLSMWRGLAPELTKVVPSVCITFSVFEALKTVI